MRWTSSFHSVVIVCVLLFSADVESQLHGQDPFAAGVRTTPWLAPADEQKKFKLPPGFEIELIAAEPQIQKPLNIAFDNRNRLWVTDSVEYPFPAPLDKPGRDTIKILEDADGNGTFEKITTFTEGLNIPIGVFPYGNGCIAWSIPNVWYFEDVDGDGKCDRKSVLYGPFDHTRDVHGNINALKRGWDGWLYANHGFNNQSRVKGADGHEIHMPSGNTFRMRVDGSRVEHFTHGQVNPFGSALDPLFNIFTADCHSKPLTQLLRGAYYPSFGAPNDGLGFVPAMMDHLHGSTAICGVVQIETPNFPPEYQGQLLSGNVMTSRLNRNELEYHGSTIRAKELSDFLSCDDPWFRPVDLHIGPDGALYMTDFYNRIIGHYEVPLQHPGRDRTSGRIWRIVYRGDDPMTKPAKMPPPLAEMPPNRLIEECNHPTLGRRLQAMELLVLHGCSSCPGEIKAELPETTPKQRTHLLWALERMNELPDDILQQSTTHDDRLVRVHAQKILAEREKWSDTDRRLALAGLRDADGFAARAAADALGRHPSPAQIRPLLDALNTVSNDDNHLRHVLRMALRDHLAATIDLSADLPPIKSEREHHEILNVATTLSTPTAGKYFLDQLKNPELKGEIAQRMAGSAGGSATIAPAQLVDVLRSRDEDAKTKLAYISAAFPNLQRRGAAEDDAWKEYSREVLSGIFKSALDRPEGSDFDWGTLQRAGDLAAKMKLASLREPLLRLAKEQQIPPAATKSVLAALLSLEPNGILLPLTAVVADPACTSVLRRQISAAVVQRKQDEQLKFLTESLKLIPARLQTMVCEELAGNLEGAEAFLSLLEEGKVAGRLSQNPTVVKKIDALKSEPLKSRLTSIAQQLPPVNEQLDKLIAERLATQQKAAVDLARGHELFKKSCAACHQVQGQGGMVAPNLDGIGGRGLERVLEDVLDPNRNVDIAFRTSTLALTDGRVLSVLVRREEGETLVVVDAQGKEFQIPKSDIERRSNSALSLMPANVAEIIPADELPNLIGYLLEQRAKQP